jgi:N6-adenosine-specific RNA methylase IME4
MTNWLQGCEICNGGLVERVEELKSEGHSIRAACRVMESEAFDNLGYKVWTSAEIRRRYQNHKSNGNGTKCAAQSQQLQNVNAIAFDNIQDVIDLGIKFGTIYADPPWAYSNQATRAATDNHYPTMSVGEIAALPIKNLSADKAHLHLWTTNAFLFESKAILEAWGFQYRSVFVWVKPQMGIGNYWRVSHEFCVLGVKGTPTFPNSAAEKSWREWPRTKHSQKPEAFVDIVEKVSPGPYLELFARCTREGWVSWGNEIKRTLFNDKAFQ